MAQNQRPRRPWEESPGAPAHTENVPKPATESQQAAMFGQTSRTHTSEFPPAPLSGLRQVARSGHPSSSLLAQLLLQPPKRVLEPSTGDDLHTRAPSPPPKRQRTDEPIRPSRGESLSLMEKQNIFGNRYSSYITPLQTCCNTACSGPQCKAIRQLASHFESELSVHELLVHGSSLDDRQTPTQDAVHKPLALLLDTICNRLRRSNTALKELLQDNAAKQAKLPGHSSPDTRRDSNTAASEPSASTAVEKHSTAAVPSARSRLQNTGHAPLSPVSMNISLPSSAAPAMSVNSISVSSTVTPPPIPSAATQTHMEDLQHQISVKTLALTTLTKEYDLLFEKLDRQRIKCATLERKFEVSDAEIISLCNQKEQMEDKIEGLERKVLKLEQERDETRKASQESNGQWMRIVEQAGRLHGGASGGDGDPGAEKPWPEEKERLTRRIEELEASLAGVKTDHRMSEYVTADLADGGDQSSSADMKWLVEEGNRLRFRNRKLEDALLAAKKASLSLAVQGQNLSSVLSRTLGDE